MNHENKIDISDIEIFSDVQSRDQESIAALCQHKYYHSGDQIIDQMSKTSDVFFISTGSVRVINLTASGKEVALEILKQGKCFGEIAAIDGGPRSSSVVALEPSKLIRMPGKDFIKILQKHPKVGLKVMIVLASVIRTSGNRITDLVTLGANARVLAELMKKIEESGTKENKAIIENFPVHSEIAQRASTTRETVTRVLSALSKKGIIKRNGTSLEVIDTAVVERTFLNLSDSGI